MKSEQSIGCGNGRWLLPAILLVALAPTLAAQPVNDNFADRIHLGGTRAMTNGTTAGATREADEPVISYPNGYPFGHTVWWSWTAPGDGLLVLSTGDAYPSFWVRVYVGTNLSELRPVSVCDSDFLGCRMVAAQVSAGENYHIVTASFLESEFLLNLAFVERPPNDDFADRIHLGSGSVTVTATNTAATREPGEFSERPIWWSWTAPASGPVTISLERGEFNPDALAFNAYPGGSVQLTVVRGDNLSSAVLITNRSSQYSPRHVPALSQVTLDVEAGATCQIATSGYLPLFSGYTLRIARTEPPRVVLTSPLQSSEFVAGNPVVFAAESLDPDGTLSGVEFFLNDVFETKSESIPDNARPFGGVWANLPPGEYDLRARATDNLGAKGDALPIRFNVRPLNDAFARRIAFTGAFVTVTGTLANASSEPDEPPGTGSGSIWWEWTAPSSGKFTIRSSSDPLAVYAGASLSELVPVGIGTFDGFATSYVSQVVVEAQAGAVYPIAIGIRGNNGGLYSLSVTKTVPPTVTITSPTPESRFIVGAPVTFAATASDADGSVRRVDFVLNDFEVLGSATNSPFTLVQTFPQGSFRHRIRAWATDDAGITTPSDTVWFEVHYPGPTNDQFADRIPFTGSFVSVTGSTANATYEPGEMNWVRDGSCWWEWTAPESGIYTITASSEWGYWPSLAVFTGTNLASLALLTNSAFVGRDYTYETRVVINAEAGTTYPIAVASRGDVTLSVVRTLPPVVRIDSPTNGSVYVVGGTINLVADAFDPDGTIAVVEFYDNGSQRLGVVTNSPFVLAVDSINANGYHVQAWATDNQGIRTISDEVEFLVRLPGPPNDHFADRIGFSGSFTSVTGSTVHATSEPGEPYFVPRDSVWWAWTAPASGDFTITAKTPSYPGPVLAVLSGTNLASLELIAGSAFRSDDPTYTSRVVLHAEAGVTYPIAVRSDHDVVLSVVQSVPPEVILASPNWDAAFRAGEPVTFSAAASDTDGSVRRVEFRLGYANELLGVATNEPFALTHVFPEGLGRTWVRASATDDAGLVTFSEPVWFEVRYRPPPNDAFVDRAPLTGTFIVTEVNMDNATQEPGEPMPFPPSQGGSAWWSWTAPASGKVFLSVSRSVWFLGAFTGSDPTNLVPIAGSTNETFNSPLQLTFDVFAGTEYQIAVVSPSSWIGPIELALFLDARELQQPRMLRPGLFGFDLRTTTERSWIVEASTNLFDWTPISTSQSVDGTLEFLDPAAADHPRRFYRAVEDPLVPALDAALEPGVPEDSVPKRE